MSLVASLSAGARASSTPAGFAGRRVMSGAIAIATFAAQVAAGATASTGAASVNVNGAPVETRFGATASPSAGAVTVAGRPALPQANGSVLVGPLVGTVALQGYAATATAFGAATALAGAVNVAGLIADASAHVIVPVTVGSVAIDGKPASSAGPAMVSTLVGSVALAGRPVAIDIGGSLLAVPSVGAVAVTGAAVSAGGATLGAPLAGPVTITGRQASAGGGRRVIVFAGAVAVAGRPAAVGNGNNATALTSTGAATIAGRTAVSRAGVRVTPARSNMAITGRQAFFSDSSLIRPVPQNGRPIVQLGLNFLTAGGGENPFKNLRNMFPGFGGDETNKIAAGEWDPTTGWGFVPPDGNYNMGRVRPMAADGINIDPGVWVLKIELEPNSGVGGTAPTVTINSPGFVDSGSSGNIIRMTRTLDETLLNGNQWSLRGGTNGGRARVVFWGPEKFENDPDGWHPSFIEYARRYDVLRQLNWEKTNGSRMVSVSERIQPGDYTIYQPYDDIGPVPSANAHLQRGGFSDRKMLELCMLTDTAAWLCLPFSLGGAAIRDTLRAANLGSGSPVTGDQLAQAVADNWGQIAIDTEIEWGLMGDRLAQDLLAVGYPDKMALFLECGNELWNGGTTAFARSKQYAQGVSRAILGSDNLGTGYGEIVAVAFRKLKERIKLAKPNQEIVFCWGVQTGAATGIGEFNLRKGVERYNVHLANQPGTVPLAEICIATTGYYSGAFQWNKNRSPGSGNPWGALTEPEFDAAFIAAHSTDEAAFQQHISAWLRNSDGKNGVQFMIDNNLAFREQMIAHGFRGMVQYEGSDHDNADVGTLRSYAGLISARINYTRSAAARDVARDAIARMRAIDPMNPVITSGWRTPELMIANFGDVSRNLTHGGPWNERTALEINAFLTEHVHEAWSEVLRFQSTTPSNTAGRGFVNVVGRPVTVSAGGPVVASAANGGVTVTGRPVIATGAGSALLARWNLNDYATIDDLATDGWTFTGDWALGVAPDGERMLSATTGVARPPLFRTEASGQSSVRLAASLRVGNVIQSADIARIIDSSTGGFATLRAASDERLSVTVFGSATTFVSAAGTQPIDTFRGVGLGFIVDDVGGFARIIDNGAANGSATGDTRAATFGGIDSIELTGNAAGVAWKGVLEIWSDATGGLAGAAALAQPTLGSAVAVGRPAIAGAGSPVLRLAAWNLDEYASRQDMIAAGWIFAEGGDWDLVDEDGVKVLTGTVGHVTPPAFRGPNSGRKDARLVYDVRFGNVLAEAEVGSFRDSAQNVGAAIRINTADRLRLRRFNGSGSVLTATASQNIGAFTETEILVLLTAQGAAEIRKSGESNGVFSGDMAVTEPAGIDTIRFTGLPERQSIRGVIEIWSNGPTTSVNASPLVGSVSATGRALNAFVRATATPSVSSVAVAGRPAIASTSGGALQPLGQWNFETYANKAAMEADGWVFEAGSDWALIDDNGVKALYGTVGYVQSPAVRADASGEKTMCAVFDMKTPNIISQQLIMQFRDRSSSQAANVMIPANERLAMRAWNGTGTILQATNAQGQGVYAKTDLTIFVDDNGYAIQKRDGVNNGVVTADTNAGTCPGINVIRFVGVTEGVFVKAVSLWARSVDVAVARVGAVTVTGRPVSVPIGGNGGAVPGVGALAISGKAVTAIARVAITAAPIKGAVAIDGKAATASAANLSDIDGGAPDSSYTLTDIDGGSPSSSYTLDDIDGGTL